MESNALEKSMNISIVFDDLMDKIYDTVDRFLRTTF